MTSTRTARESFTALKGHKDQITGAEIDDFRAALDPAIIDFMRGEWQAGEPLTGHNASGLMEQLNWFGKTFVSATDARPFGLPGRRLKGEASRWMEEFHGEVVASMVHDGAQVHDHFEFIDENAVLGIMNDEGALDLGSGSTCTSTSSGCDVQLRRPV